MVKRVSKTFRLPRSTLEELSELKALMELDSGTEALIRSISIARGLLSDSLERNINNSPQPPAKIKECNTLVKSSSVSSVGVSLKQNDNVGVKVWSELLGRYVWVDVCAHNRFFDSYYNLGGNR